MKNLFYVQIFVKGIPGHCREAFPKLNFFVKSALVLIIKTLNWIRFHLKTNTFMISSGFPYKNIFFIDNIENKTILFTFHVLK